MSSFKDDYKRACKALRSINSKITVDMPMRRDLLDLLYVLDSPLFTQLVSLDDSLDNLRLISREQNIDVDSFEFENSTGELMMQTNIDMIEDKVRVEVPTTSTSKDRNVPVRRLGMAEQIERAARGRSTEIIVLKKDENDGLGFGVVELRSEQTGELGIYVHEMQAAGVADIDDRLRVGDEILSIDDQFLESNMSHEQVLQVLRDTKGLVKFVVAREQSKPVVQSRGIEDARQQTDTSLIDWAQAAVSADYTVSDVAPGLEWTQLEVIHLVNDGTGLGFGIVGGKNVGVMVKTILPGGVADRDGRLRSGDHLIQIGDINVGGMGSDLVANILRKSSAHVRLIVARAVTAGSTDNPPFAPIVPTEKIKEHVERLLDMLSVFPGTQDGKLGACGGGRRSAELHQTSLDEQLSLLHLGGADMDTLDVKLVKDSLGLGVTIAGYFRDKTVTGSDDLSGIFVRSITEGSAADRDGRIHVHDQIIAVDGQSLDGFSNQQAVELLRKTGQVVDLKLARYRNSSKLNELISGFMHEGDASDKSSLVSSNQASNSAVQLFNMDDYSGELSSEIEDIIVEEWSNMVDENFEIVVAQVCKFQEGGGLGISLEGTVDVENGIEVHPHHFIRSVITDGPVGIHGRLRNGDELLEVNGVRLLGLNHIDVVNILKDLPLHVRIVCARRMKPLDRGTISPTFSDIHPSSTTTRIKEDPFRLNNPFNPAANLITSKFDRPDYRNTGFEMRDLDRSASSSLEPLTGLAFWSNEIVFIELEKGEKGLGFSILDYQDPINADETVIVIRGLVANGVAQKDGRLVPGDRLLFVNDANLAHATLDEAVQALKKTKQGLVQLGVAKPLLFQPDVRTTGSTTTAFTMTAGGRNADSSPLTISPSTKYIREVSFPSAPSPTQYPHEVPPPLPFVENTAIVPTEHNPQIHNISVPEQNKAASVPTTSHLSKGSCLTSASSHRSAPSSTFTLESERATSGSIVTARTFPTDSLSEENISSSGISTPTTGECSLIGSPVSSRGSKPELPPKPVFVDGVLVSTSRPGSAGSLAGVNKPIVEARKDCEEVAKGAQDEQTICIQKGILPLGVHVDAVTGAAAGCKIRSLTTNQAAAKDGRLKVGDFLVAVNGEPMKGITSAQARAVLRRADLQTSDVSLTYISSSSVTQNKDLSSKFAGIDDL